MIVVTDSNDKYRISKSSDNGETWREFLEHTPDLITRWNGKIELVYANTAFEKRMGLSLSALQNKHFNEINLPEFCTNSFMSKLEAVYKTGSPEDYFHSISFNGETIHLHSSIIPELDDDNAVHSILAIASDITKLKAAEAILKEKKEQENELTKEKIRDLNHSLSKNNRMLDTLNAELKTFSSIAANDYKETLRNLYTSMEFIISNDARNLSDAGKANIRRAQAAIQKMKLLTDDIIAYSSVQMEERVQSTLKLDEIVTNVICEMDRKINEAGAVIKVDKLPVIEGDSLSISLLFRHLIDNAIKFRSPNVAPMIRIVSSKTAGMNINHADADPSVWYHIISVIDNGIGFEEQFSKKIFIMFQRLHERNKYKGSGIGLALCKKIMNMHDGFITAESIPHTGTTFNCFFPIKQQPDNN